MKVHVQRAQKGFTLIELLVVITIIALLASLAMPVYSTVTQRGNIIKGTSNCRQIITALKVYSSDNSGNYPDAASSAGGGGQISNANDAYRQLFIGGILTDERIFGCPASKANPDGNIGSSPSFTQAVQPGENHWAMTGTLTDSSSASYPIVYENPTTAQWNPSWNVQAVGTAQPGRVWSGPRIIIGLNDGSVQTMKLTTDGTVAPNASATVNQFTINTQNSNGAASPTVLAAQESGSQ